jgi:DNA uptake protein ComE-like DNA-binding protein
MIHLNSCTVEDLGPHPYAGWKLAKVLVAYRRQHGPFPTIDAITGCLLVTDSIRDRLGPYLTLE